MDVRNGDVVKWAKSLHIMLMMSVTGGLSSCPGLILQMTRRYDTPESTFVRNIFVLVFVFLGEYFDCVVSWAEICPKGLMLFYITAAVAALTTAAVSYSGFISYSCFSFWFSSFLIFIEHFNLSHLAPSGLDNIIGCVCVCVCVELLPLQRFIFSLIKKKKRSKMWRISGGHATGYNIQNENK